jgi:hypothetical protein
MTALYSFANAAADRGRPVRFAFRAPLETRLGDEVIVKTPGNPPRNGTLVGHGIFHSLSLVRFPEGDARWVPAGEVLAVVLPDRTAQRRLEVVR